jgi:glyoxylase-like metal-dependent hydrolase (beta-lactamase superfamily II)
MTTVEVDVLVAGEAPSPRAYVFRPAGGNAVTRVAAALRPGAPTIPLPFLAFLVRHPTAGPIAIDTGLHPRTIENRRADYGLAMGMLFRTLKPAGPAYDEQLRALGVEPEEIELAVMTHLHVDHTGGMRLLPRAEFACARAEWEAATGPHPARGGYVPHQLPPAGRMRLLDLDGEHDLLGDGSIRLLPTPGHTPGHLSVLLQTGGHGQVLLVGDAAYTRRSIDEQILPLLTADEGAYRRSLAELKAFAERNPDALVIPTHDPDAWRALTAVGATGGASSAGS